MIIKFELFQLRRFFAAALVTVSFTLAAAASDTAGEGVPAKRPASIPCSQIGAKAGADYQGEGLTVIPTAEGARLSCVFQRLEGEVTREGLWLTSTATNTINDRFRVVAAAVGRTADFGVRRQSAAATPLFGSDQLEVFRPDSESGVALRFPPQSKALPRTGTVSIHDQVARFTRQGLVEEYSVSMDGVRQDFVVLEKPFGRGELVVQLAISGATVEQLADGARLVLQNSGRKIAYSRLRVTDATGRELEARMETFSVGDEVTSLKSNSEKEKVETSQSLLTSAPTGERHSRRFETANTAGVADDLDIVAPATVKRPQDRAPMLAVIVNDFDAAYPVRIDPTFSDANWISMGGIPGADSIVYAAVADGSGNLYIGGEFTVAGDVVVSHIAKWNGNAWSALGSGMDSDVYALAVSGSDLYAGGYFTNAGGSAANYVAKWNGNGWSALGSGMDSDVYALAVSGSDLYAGGYFTTAGGSLATNVAKWNGSNWSALGSGMDEAVYALAVSGSDLYAGGRFETAGGSPATNVAKWNGSSWSALGSGMGGNYPGVYALAVSGGDLYAGGWFTTAGGISANSIAKWNGSSWSALGSGMEGAVYALAVSGSDLYAGGSFETAGGNPAENIAKWDGNSWIPLGSGMGIGDVRALAVSGSTVFAGGYFQAAGGRAAQNIAKWNGNSWSAMGSGLNNSVYALAVSGGDVFAGGYFSMAGGIPAKSIAKWNGSSWSPLGSGLNYGAEALAVSGSDLYAGGFLTTAGGKVSAYLAKAIVNPPVLTIEPDGFGGYFIDFSGVPGSAYLLQRAPTLQGPWASSAPQTAPASGQVEFWDLFPPPAQGYYRSVQP